jgi:hypothetical protein
MAFKDKNEFEAGDREDEFQAGAFPLESADMESPDEESPDDEEEELSEEELAEEMKPFTLAEWQQSIPDYTAHEFEEKLPNRTRSSWMAPVMSCLWGTLLGAVIAGLLMNNQLRPQQVRAFFIFFLFFAPLFSFVGHWFFVLHPQRLAKKLNEESTRPIGSEPIHPK